MTAFGELWALGHEKLNSMRPDFLFGVLLLSACSQAAAIDHDQPVFGMWETPGGLRVVVSEQGGYTVCAKGICDEGIALIQFGGTAASLKAFFEKPVVQEYTKAHGINGNPNFRGPAFQLMTGKISAEDEKRICKGRPCVVLGRLDHPNPEPFLKLAE